MTSEPQPAATERHIDAAKAVLEHLYEQPYPRRGTVTLEVADILHEHFRRLVPAAEVEELVRENDRLLKLVNHAAEVLAALSQQYNPSLFVIRSLATTMKHDAALAQLEPGTSQPSEGSAQDQT